MCKYAGILFKFLCIAILLIADAVHCLMGLNIVFNNTSQVNACSKLWVYVLFGSIISFANLLCKLKIVRETQNSYWLVHNYTIAYAFMTLIIIIWGTVVYMTLSDECSEYHHDNAPQLYTFYDITFWYYVAQLCILPVVAILISFCGCFIHKLFHRGNADASIYVRNVRHHSPHAIPLVDAGGNDNHV